MPTSNAMIPFLVGMMLLTGVCNTLFTKYQDIQCVRNCSSSDPKARRNFEQPVWQTAQMFVGEAGCWLVVLASALYKRYIAKDTTRGRYEPVDVQTSVVDGSSEEPVDADSGIAKPLEPTTPERQTLSGSKVLLLALPACFDLIATSLMNIGLLFVAASIYQMTRGALVLFVGLFSVLFLRSRLSAYKWLSLVIVVLGVAIVGLAGIVENRKDRRLPGDPNPKGEDSALDLARASLLAVRDILYQRAPLEDNIALQTALGIIIIFLAQIFTASQFVIEESIMHRYSITPLAMVGWEGVYGLFVTLLAMLIAHLAYGRTDAGRGGYFDATTGWREMTQIPAIGYTSLLIMISIGGFNFFGLSVTRSVSATSRSTIDTCRTLFIWIVSLGLGWESFKWLQVLGFAALVYGTFLFNDIVRPPTCWRRLGWRRGRAEAEDLLPNRPPGLAES